MPSEPDSTSSSETSSASSIAVIEPSVNKYLRSCASRKASCRRNHSSAIAACSFSSSRLCSSTARSSSPPRATARWSYQSIASSSSMIETIARWRSIASVPSTSGDSCNVALDPAMPRSSDHAARHIVRLSPGNLPADLGRHVLDLEVLVDALVAALAPESRVLHSPELSRRVRDQPSVQSHHSGLQPLDDAERPVEVARVRVRHEAEAGVVGGAERLVVRREGRDRRHRSEDLLAQHPRVRRNVAEDGRRVEVAGAVERLPADERLGAPVAGVVDQLDDLLARLRLDQRPDLDPRLGPAPDAHATEALGESGRELVADRLVHVEPVGGGARLADVAHLG